LLERARSDHRVLRISGRAYMNTDRNVQRTYELRVARKYILTPGGIFNYLSGSKTSLSFSGAKSISFKVQDIAKSFVRVGDARIQV
jgi:hypothetical protein